MNIFFYAAGDSECHGTCHYRSCSKRCLSLVEGLPPLRNVKILPSGSNFKTSSAMRMRSGDVIILFVRNHHDIEELISIRDFLETFRLILIIGEGEENITRDGRYFLLNPRYTTPLGKNMHELSVVIDRIASQPCEQ